MKIFFLMLRYVISVIITITLNYIHTLVLPTAGFQKEKYSKKPFEVFFIIPKYYQK